MIIFTETQWNISPIKMKFGLKLIAAECFQMKFAGIYCKNPQKKTQKP